jgi:hypothetical protein
MSLKLTTEEHLRLVQIAVLKSKRNFLIDGIVARNAAIKQIEM